MLTAQLPRLTASSVWLSEHYWPDLGEGLVLAQVQRAALVRPPVRWVATFVLPGQQLALCVLAGPSQAEVTRSLSLAGIHPDRVNTALHVIAEATDGRHDPTVTREES